MENPIKIDDLGVPLFSETSILWKRLYFRSWCCSFSLERVDWVDVDNFLDQILETNFQLLLAKSVEFVVKNTWCPIWWSFETFALRPNGRKTLIGSTWSYRKPRSCPALCFEHCQAIQVSNRNPSQSIGLCIVASPRVWKIQGIVPQFRWISNVYQGVPRRPPSPRKHCWNQHGR